MPAASVIIPFKDEQTNLTILLNCIKASLDVFSDIEVILVNNCSIDESPQIAKSFVEMSICDARMINAVPANRSLARNSGAKIANGKILIFMDSDCRFEPDSIKNLIFEMENRTDLCAMQGKFDLNYLHQHLSRKFLDTKCIAIWAEGFWQIQGFDQKLSRCEDIDLSWRLLDCNFNFDICATALFSRAMPKSLVQSFCRGVATGRALVCLHKKWELIGKYSFLKILNGFIDIGRRELKRTFRIQSSYSQLCSLVDGCTTLVSYIIYRLVLRS